MAVGSLSGMRGINLAMQMVSQGTDTLDAAVEGVKIQELDPADEIVVYCHQGVRSAAVAAFLREQGFAKAVNLAGGLDLWARTVDPSMRRY